MQIDLNDYRRNSVKVFSGRELGKRHRQKANLDRIDKTNEPVSIIVPDDVYSINSSYFLGFFGPSIKRMGEDKFREKYKFQCDEIINKNIEDGIASALKENDTLKGR